MRLTIRASFLGSFGQERVDAHHSEALRALYFWYRNLPPTLFKVNNHRKLKLAGPSAVDGEPVTSDLVQRSSTFGMPFGKQIISTSQFPRRDDSAYLATRFGCAVYTRREADRKLLLFMAQRRSHRKAHRKDPEGGVERT
jgi:hypothetical protein